MATNTNNEVGPIPILGEMKLTNIGHIWIPRDLPTHPNMELDVAGISHSNHLQWKKKRNEKHGGIK